MQNPHDLSPLGIPQPKEKSCERCSHLGLECVVERTCLGRPALKRLHRTTVQENSPECSAGSKAHDGSISSTLSNMDIKEHLFADLSDLETPMIQRPAKQELFQSMIEPHYFLSSILAKDQAFGADMAQVPSRWSIFLPDLVDNDMANSLEKR